jgi:hypothetical protein
VCSAGAICLSRRRASCVRGAVSSGSPDFSLVSILTRSSGSGLSALTSAEVYSWHRQWMKDGADKYDPRVIVRIRPGETMTAANYIELMKLRGRAPRLVDPLRAMAIRDKPIAPGSPWQNSFAERLIAIRRECVDHIVVLGEAHLRQTLREYARYYNTARTHRSLDQDAPVSRHVWCGR